MPLMSFLGAVPIVIAQQRAVLPPCFQEPFPTVPPPNVEFPTPFAALPTDVARPGAFSFQTIDQSSQPTGDVVTGLYLGGGLVSLLGAGALIRVSRRAVKWPRSASTRGLSVIAGKPPAFRFRPRLARLAWIAPLSGSIVMFGLAVKSCQRPEICYATVGGIQVVVPCEGEEGAIEGKATATSDPKMTPTPYIDCPDPGRGGTDAYEIAKAGGKHSGYLNQARNWATESLLSALGSYEANVLDHARKISDPSGQTLDTPWGEMDSRQQQGLLNRWCTDLTRNRELADVMYGILRERGVQP